MSHKFLTTESPAWVTEGLITEAQRQHLLARYPPEAAQAVGLLPLLGSLLVGLSALSVVAANWQTLGTTVRLALLLGSLLSAYGAGNYFLRRGNRRLGHSLVGLGLILFGVSIILTSQLYQLVGYDASGLLAWVVAGVALTFVYDSRWLALLTVGIAVAVQTYCTQALGSFSYATAGLLGVGLGWFWWRRADAVFSSVLAIGVLWQAGLWVALAHAKITWFFIPAMFVYAAGDWHPAPGSGPRRARPAAGGGLLIRPRPGPVWRNRPLRRLAAPAGAGVPGGTGGGAGLVGGGQAAGWAARHAARLAAAAAGVLLAGWAAAGHCHAGGALRPRRLHAGPR